MRVGKHGQSSPRKNAQPDANLVLGKFDDSRVAIGEPDKQRRVADEGGWPVEKDGDACPLAGKACKHRGTISEFVPAVRNAFIVSRKEQVVTDKRRVLQ